MPKLIIYLVRHAQTSGNVTMKLMEGHEDNLTELGKVQTNLLGMYLSHINFDYVFASDYSRAVCTADGILKFSSVSTNPYVQTDKRLREVDGGDLDGKSYKAIMRYCVSINKPILEWDFPGGESLTEVGKRMLNFVEEICVNILANEQPKPVMNVLVVSHSAAMAIFLNTLFESSVHEVAGWNPTNDWKLMENTSYMKIEVEIKPNDMMESSIPDNFLPRCHFKFLEKHVSSHLDCIKSITKSSNGVTNFAKTNEAGKEYLRCIQQ